jgi:hypothetical protein
MKEMEQPVSCPICGELYELNALVPSPSGSHVLMCRDCANEITLDLRDMHGGESIDTTN